MILEVREIMEGRRIKYLIVFIFSILGLIIAGRILDRSSLPDSIYKVKYAMYIAIFSLTGIFGIMGFLKNYTQ